MVGQLYDRPTEWLSQTFTPPCQQCAFRARDCLACVRMLFNMRLDDPVLIHIRQINALRAEPAG